MLEIGRSTDGCRFGGDDSRCSGFPRSRLRVLSWGEQSVSVIDCNVDTMRLAWESRTCYGRKVGGEQLNRQVSWWLLCFENEVWLVHLLVLVHRSLMESHLQSASCRSRRDAAVASLFDKDQMHRIKSIVLHPFGTPQFQFSFSNESDITVHTSRKNRLYQSRVDYDGTSFDPQPIATQRRLLPHFCGSLPLACAVSRPFVLGISRLPKQRVDHLPRMRT